MGDARSEVKQRHMKIARDRSCIWQGCLRRSRKTWIALANEIRGSLGCLVLPVVMQWAVTAELWCVTKSKLTWSAAAWPDLRSSWPDLGAGRRQGRGDVTSGV